MEAIRQRRGKQELATYKRSQIRLSHISSQTQETASRFSCFLVSSRSEIDEVDIGRVTDKDGYNTKPPPSPSPISHNAHKKETANVIH